MRVRRAGSLWLLAWCGPLLLVVFAAEVVAAEPPVLDLRNDFENTYPNLVFGSVVPLLGALILTRLPRHPIGWIFLGSGLASAITLAVYPYAHEGLGPAHLPGALAAAWVSEWIWGFGLIPLVTLGVLLFPDGRPPSPRWRLLLLLDSVALLLVFLANAFHPGPLVNHPAADNPIGIPLPRGVFTALGSAGFALFATGFVGSALAALVRWRRSRGAERAQLSWFAFSATVIVTAFLAPLPTTLADVVLFFALPLLPVSIAVAILRRHLYGIEVVVRRSLVYFALTTVLVIGYAATVAGLGALLQGRAGETAALVATALVAVAFAPARQRLQKATDRLLYGDRGDPYAVLADVGRRLEMPSSAADPLVEIAAVVASSLRLPYVRVEVDRPDGGPAAAEHGKPTAEVHEVVLTFGGRPVGRLLVAPRSPLDPFRASDLRLLDDLGRQVGVAAHALGLAAELQASREGLVNLREEERRRIRRDLHDGLGPALAGVALGLDAVHRLARTDPEEAASLADQLKREVQDSLADVRRLVEDLRPPALDQLGLVGAVRQQARAITERDPGLDVEVESAGVTTLSAAVEVAAYRIATEALTNVARHAGARHCRVDLRMNGSGMLVLRVEDDGTGLPSRPRAGVGLTAMRERAAELGGTCEARPVEPSGTLVLVRLPVRTGNVETAVQP